MVLLFLCLIVLEVFQYWELKKLCKQILEKPQETVKKEPPKARHSFVVKRMEERLKEALYE